LLANAEGSQGQPALVTVRSGIEVYAHWQGKALAKERGQINGHTVMHGHAGYPKEASDGEPYAIPSGQTNPFSRLAC